MYNFNKINKFVVEELTPGIKYLSKEELTLFLNEIDKCEFFNKQFDIYLALLKVLNKFGCFDKLSEDEEKRAKQHIYIILKEARNYLHGKTFTRFITWFNEYSLNPTKSSPEYFTTKMWCVLTVCKNKDYLIF